MLSRRGVLALGFALGVAGCGPPGPMTLDGVTIMRHGFMDGGPAALYTGPVRFEEGCVVASAGLDAAFVPVIWPPTAALSHAGDELVVLVNGLVIHDGDQASIGGGEYKDVDFVEQLSGPIPEACRAEYYWLAGEVSKP
jgi:hypothetical protein